MSTRGIARAVGAALATALAACTPAASQVTRPPRALGWLHTSGTKILDASGHTIRLVGVAHHGMDVGRGLPQPEAEALTGCRGWSTPTASEYADIASWGFNSVRLAVSWANLEPVPPTVGPRGGIVHHYNQTYVQAIDQIVRQFGSRGVAVILDMHQYRWSPAFRALPTPTGSILCQGSGMPAWLYPDQAISFSEAKCDFFSDRVEPGVRLPSVQRGFIDAWSYLAGRYANDPTVIGADVLNEPYHGPGCTAAALHLNAFYAKAGAAIRAADPHLLLVFEDSEDDGTGIFALTAPPPFKDEVYSFHMYVDGWQPAGLNRVNDFLSRAKAWHLPTWMGEFNRFGPSDAVAPDWAAQMGAMLDDLRRQGASWCYWAYGGTDPLVDTRGGLNTDLLAELQAGF
jgi:hypothetical protein